MKEQFGPSQISKVLDQSLAYRAPARRRWATLAMPEALKARQRKAL